MIVLGQIPWLRDIVALLPQKGPIETFHSVSEPTLTWLHLLIDNKFSCEKVRQAKASQGTAGIKKDILSLIVRT